MSKIKKDQVLGFIGLIAAAFIAYETSLLKQTAFIGDPGPKMFPYLASVLMAICSAILIVKPTGASGSFLTKKQWLNAACLFGVYVLNALLLLLVGFNIAVPIVLFIVTFMFSKVSNKNASLKSRIIKSVIYALVGGVVLYLMYNVALDAQLPKGLILQWLK